MLLTILCFSFVSRQTGLAIPKTTGSVVHGESHHFLITTGLRQRNLWNHVGQ